MSRYTSIDLFSGPGGLCTGFKWADIRPLIAVEMSHWTAQTYSATHNADIFPLEQYLNGELPNSDEFFERNDKTLLIHGDVTKVSNELIKKILKMRFDVDSVDIVTGGAPCESFSMAGDRKEDDERNNLFLNIVRIARNIDSKMILFENVKGLFSKKADGIAGKMFEDICDEFSRVDPDTNVSFTLASRDKKVVLLKASEYGVPQNRERIFLVGINSKYDAEFNYPQKTNGPDSDQPFVSVMDAISDLPKVQAGQSNSNYEETEPVSNMDPHRREYLQFMRGVNGNVPPHIGFTPNHINDQIAVNHRTSMIGRMKLIRQGESMKTAAERLISEGNSEQVGMYFPKKLFGARNRRLVPTQPSFTVTSHCLDEMIHPFYDRGLTPREVARLQSFPDWYVFMGPYVKFHSDPEQDRYEQIGDAIPPLLAYALAKEITKTLKQIYSNSNQEKPLVYQ